MGSSASIHCEETKYVVNLQRDDSSRSNKSIDKDDSLQVKQTGQVVSFGMDNLMKNMRFYQNAETSEVIFLVGSDRIENVPKINKEEWIEVNVSGLQDDYVRQTMQSKSLSQRRMVNSGPIEDTISLSTATDGHFPNTAVSETGERSLRDGHDDDDHDDEEFKSHTNSVATEHSSQRSGTSKNKIKIPWECPYCDHTFGRFDNKNKHIAECRHADEVDTQTIKQFVDLISQSNHDVMSEAMMEAVQQFEEQVRHRRSVLLLLKRLQFIQKNSNRDSVDVMQNLLTDFRDEKKELANLIIPVHTRSTTFAKKRNIELNSLMDYLDKGITVLKRKIATKNSFHMEDFTVGNVLRTGSFSTVHLAKCNANGRLYALKVMNREFLREQNMEHQILRECEVMEHTTLYPDMFLRLFFHEVRDNHICILMEYVPTGDCLQLMKSFGGNLPSDISKHIISNLIVGISFLHAHGVVHRDIKPDNLLITPQGNVKLVDFGMSTHYHCNISASSSSDDKSLWLEDMKDISCGSHILQGKSETDMSISSFRFGADRVDEDVLKTLVGNVNYAAPEVLEGEGYDHCIDWWALGVLYFHFISGTPPFYAPSDSETKYNVVKGKIHWSMLNKDTTSSCRDFIGALLERSPKMRLGAQGVQEVQHHDHFADTDFSEVLQRPGPFQPKENEVVFKPLDVNFF